MKRKNLILIATFVLSLAGALVVYFSNSEGTVKPELKNFAVEDTSDIDKIFLADKSNHQVLLTKEAPGKWMVNGKYYARKDMLDNLMDVIRRVTVRSIVAKAAQENIIKRMATGSIKVEIYKSGNLHKVYYVGSGTMDNIGSFMLLENSSAPFICFLPGHKGTITNFFMPLESEWRNRLIFNHSFKEMESVSVAYPYNPENNFTIEILGNNDFRIKADGLGRYLPTFDTSLVKSYLLEYKNIAFEDFTTVSPEKMDSVRAKHHLFTISVKEKNGGKIKSVKGYRLPLPPNVTDDFGKPILFDEDRMYGEFNDIEEFIILQYYTFDRIAVPVSFFYPKPKR
ncbi:MAG: hypothetical protein MH137_10350 [Flavobacteriales bacterium]|nr:hypothetical protein [Flavobacteriales bacterium]